MDIARAAVTPHRIQRIAQTIQQHTGRARQHEPEQRGEDRVVAVFQHRFNRGARHGFFIQMAGIAADHQAHLPARFRQASNGKGGSHALGMLAQAARCDREIQHHYRK